MRRAALILSLVLLAGCRTIAPTPAASGDVARLLAHPELSAAVEHAPNFTEDALKTVSRLTAERK